MLKEFKEITCFARIRQIGSIFQQYLNNVQCLVILNQLEYQEEKMQSIQKLINQIFQKKRIQGYINYQQYIFEKRMKFSNYQTQFKSILIFIEKIYQICQMFQIIEYILDNQNNYCQIFRIIQIKTNDAYYLELLDNYLE
ncbi:unnamed protein product [Paramecium primaurelia]|uniref:Uncharacterized protein n=1 Tax=Paramecium primaurelia TaxID=5886 RepID=A0A8S1M079_PARPR|nr:unnamed protein product [Paramecium primaurelia]